MDEEKLGLICMELVVNGGNARSCALEAVHAARKKDFVKADRLLKECDAALESAHEIQTEMLQKEASGDHMPVYLLMVHAQDHLMNAMTVRDLAVEIIELWKE